MTFKEVQASLERIKSQTHDEMEQRLNLDNLSVSNINERKARVNY